MDLALNNLQSLICHKIHQTKPNQTLNVVLGTDQGNVVQMIGCFTYCMSHFFINQKLSNKEANANRVIFAGIAKQLVLN